MTLLHRLRLRSCELIAVIHSVILQILLIVLHLIHLIDACFSYVAAIDIGEMLQRLIRLPRDG